MKGDIQILDSDIETIDLSAANVDVAFPVSIFDANSSVGKVILTDDQDKETILNSIYGEDGWDCEPDNSILTCQARQDY